MRRMVSYSDGILMILAGVTFAVVLMVVPDVGASAHNSDAQARQDFDALVETIAERYQLHAKTVPMMWLVNLCARSATSGGVHGMKVVEFEGVSKIDDDGRAQLGDLVQERLGKRWSPTVRRHQEHGEDSSVYAQSDEGGKRTRLIVLDFDDNELDMVSLSLNPEQLAKWTKEQDAKDGRKGNALGAVASK